MATLMVRNLPDEGRRALRLRAAEHGRSTEEEVRAILAEAVKAPGAQRLGGALAALGREVVLSDADLALTARQAGRGLSTADGYIAAIAARWGCTAASRDVSPYSRGRVDGDRSLDRLPLDELSQQAHLAILTNPRP
jgi:plasmid stability protein